MKVLVLGGTGVISRQIVKQAIEKGYEVTVFNRGNKKLDECKGAREMIGDRRSEEFEHLFDGQVYDTVIDMICYDEKDGEQTLRVFGDKAKQVIVTSSSAIYDRTHHAYPLTEKNTRLRTTEEFPYGYHKARMDEYLQSQMGMRDVAITVIRPSLTFGDGAANFGMLRQNRNVVRRIRDGKSVVMIGEGVIPWSFTFAKDLASAYVLACGNKNTYNEVFHVTNTEVVMWEDLYRVIGTIVGREPEMAYIPTAVLHEAFPEVGAHLHLEKVYCGLYSNEKFQKAVPEYQPKVTLEQGVRELIEGWEENEFPYDEEKDLLEDRICEIYKTFKEQLAALRD